MDGTAVVDVALCSLAVELGFGNVARVGQPRGVRHTVREHGRNEGPRVTPRLYRTRRWALITGRQLLRTTSAHLSENRDRVTPPILRRHRDDLLPVPAPVHPVGRHERLPAHAAHVVERQLVDRSVGAAAGAGARGGAIARCRGRRRWAGPWRVSSYVLRSPSSPRSPRGPRPVDLGKARW